MTKINLSITLLFACSVCLAQSVTLYTSQNGLTGTLVRDVFIDSNSMVWVSTETGLNRYDGTRFIQYFHDPYDNSSLANNFVNSVFQDS